MKTILMAGLASLLPALAQSPADAIARAEANLRDAQNLQTALILTRGSNTPVLNAPYSADAVTETTQVLGDGNRIVQRTTQKLYRDSEGRERREESVLAVGALAQADGRRVITIFDPVAKISYTLDPNQRTARRSVPMPGIALPAYFGTLGVYRLNGNPVAAGRGRGRGAGGEFLREDLGSKNVEGVIAQGTRTTTTIPAGQIGNQLPIKIVDEVWHSAELQMDVMSTHSDPRSAETVYKLTNIVRANPPRALFEPPTDYTIIDATGPGRSGAPAPGAAGGRGGRGGPGGRQQ